MSLERIRKTQEDGKAIMLVDISYLRTNDNISPSLMLFRTANFHPRFPKEEESWGIFIWDENMRIKIFFIIA